MWGLLIDDSQEYLRQTLSNDMCQFVDSNATRANVGARKVRIIRDNRFVLNAVTNSITRCGEYACEIGVYNAEKCSESI